MTAPAKVWEAQRRINERDARIAELEADQQDWRKGVALIASALGEPKPPDLSCVRIADVALTLRAKTEELEAERDRLKYQLLGYGNHKMWCRQHPMSVLMHGSGVCTCGWDEVRRALEE